MHITLIEATNFKRLKAIRIKPTEKGLTVISGKNGQGKTSVLDAIAFAFGGKRYCPSNPRRENAIGETMIRIETDNGLIIERKGKNLDLVVTDSTGKRHGQALLDAFISEFAINLPKFMNSSDKDKADTLLKILGISEKLSKLEACQKSKYDTRTVIGRQADQKEMAAKDMPYHDDVGEEPLSVRELIDRNQAILSRNGIKENAKQQLEHNKQLLSQYKAQVETLNEQIATIQSNIETLEKNIAIAENEDLTLESTDEIQKQIDEIEETNRKINENKERTRKIAESEELRKQYNALTEEIEKIRKDRIALLNNANLPYPGLSVENGVLTLDGKSWDCFSSSQQLIVGTAIASKLNPDCKFVLLDKLEQLDKETMEEFNKWLVERGIQSIATRVGSDDEASIIIEDGEVVNDEQNLPQLKKDDPLPEY